MTESGPAENRRFGLLAVVLGCLAFAGIVGHFFAGPFDPPPPLEMSIAEQAVKIRDATVAALKGEEYTAESRVRHRSLDDYLTYSFIATGVLAIILAVVGFIQKEPLRPIIAGAALGGLAITFQFAIILFFGLLFALVLGSVIDKLDFSF